MGDNVVTLVLCWLAKSIVYVKPSQCRASTAAAAAAWQPGLPFDRFHCVNICRATAWEAKQAPSEALFWAICINIASRSFVFLSFSSFSFSWTPVLIKCQGAVRWGSVAAADVPLGRGTLLFWSAGVTGWRRSGVTDRLLMRTLTGKRSLLDIASEMKCLGRWTRNSQTSTMK